LEIIELPVNEWDLEKLNHRQLVELYAIGLSYVIYPKDEAKRCGNSSAIISTIFEENSSIHHKKASTFALQISLASLKKNETNRIAALSKMTSFLCRMIEHHAEDLQTKPSLKKARFLIEHQNSAGKKGYSDSTLKNIWRDNKGIAALTTAFVLGQKRAARKIRKTPDLKNSPEFNHKCIAIQISEVIKIFAHAQAIEKMLLNYSSKSRNETILEEQDIITFNKKINIPDNSPRWRALNEHQLEHIKKDLIVRTDKDKGYCP